jgi:hypothetical protein
MAALFIPERHSCSRLKAALAGLRDTLKAVVPGSFRHHRSAPSWLAALVLLAWLTPIAVPHVGGDDLLCLRPASTDAALSAKATIEDADQQGHHCVICHSARSYRTALSDLGPAPVALESEHTVASVATVNHRAPALDGLPARAPPA